LVPTDKAANNTTLICKRLYVHKLRQELTGSDDVGTYRDVNKSIGRIMMAHKALYEKLKLELPCELLPYLYWLPKLHKKPIGARFIAGSGLCSIKTLNKLLGRILRLISLTAKEQDNVKLARTGVRRYFIVEGYLDVVGFLNGWKREGKVRRLDTLDFSTLYTRLDLGDLVEKISRVVDETVKSRAEPRYEWMFQVHLSKAGLPQRAEWVDVKKSVHRPSLQIFNVM